VKGSVAPAKESQAKKKIVASAAKGGSRFGCCSVFILLVAIFFAYGFATNPNFPKYVMFSWDHFQGRFGFQQPGYHCKNNRFGHSLDYDTMVAEARPGKARPPPAIDAKDYTPEKMKILSNNYRLPVVIKGLFAESVAGRTWTQPWFAENYGKQTVIYHDLEFPIQGITSSFQRQHLPTSLAEYIRNVSDGGHRVLGNDHYMLLDHPKLIEHLELQRWISFDEMPILPLSLRLFMGGIDTGVGWHAATSHNLFIEVKGKKLFKWFPPNTTSLADLHPTLSNKLPAIEHCPGHYYNPALETWEYVLDDGDAAFTPAWVWHATRHLEPTIAVGLRMESFLHDARSASLLAFLSEFSSDLPGLPGFNAFTRGILQFSGVRLQGQALSEQEQREGYAMDWLRDYIQAGGKLTSEDERDSQWKL